ncbi:MAG: thioether cross-link-forming SCIFF peptide maturase [Christensenellales bacterium]|jgi:uncharacterized protein
MVHTFFACGIYVALDVDSGSVFQIDPVAHEVILRYEEASYDEIFDELSPRFGRQAVSRAYEEIQDLVSQGIIFTRMDYAPLLAEHDDAGVIKAMCLNIAHDCNLRCAYCFAGTGVFGGGRCVMTAETGKNALDFLMRHCGNRRHLEVDFFGGEPTLVMDTMREIVAYGRELEKLHDKQIAFTVTTNCAHISDETIEFFDREMHNVVLSLDGRKKVHDRMRRTPQGTGSFDLVAQNALKIATSRREKHLEYFVRGTFTKNNLDFARDVLAMHDMGFEHVSVEPVVAPEEASYALLDEHLPQIRREYEVLARQYRQRRQEGRPFIFFHFMLDLQGGPCLPKRLKGCGAGNEYVAVVPDGGIYPCHQFDGNKDFLMGNVNSGAVDEAMRTMFRDNHALNKPDCRACWAKFFCSGGCVANAVAYNGDMKKPHAISCEMEKKRLECAIALWVLQREEEPS